MKDTGDSEKSVGKRSEIERLRTAATSDSRPLETLSGSELIEAVRGSLRGKGSLAAALRRSRWSDQKRKDAKLARLFRNVHQSRAPKS